MEKVLQVHQRITDQGITLSGQVTFDVTKEDGTDVTSVTGTYRGMFIPTHTVAVDDSQYAIDHIIVHTIKKVAI